MSNFASVPRLPKRVAGPVTIGICAPSGTIDAEALARATTYLEAAGHRIITTPQTTMRWRYFAGPDQDRLDAFHSLLADPTIDIIMAARGGYGWTRLLAHIDFDAVAATDKIIVGFSDFTAFNLAALAKTGLITFAGPMATSDFGNGDVSPFMESHFWPLLAASDHAIQVDGEQLYSSQIIEGQLWGSNLSLLAHLVGTPYMPTIENGILFIEEIAEEPYAVERMFFQLYHAGILHRQRALILADVDNCKPSAKSRSPYCMAEVIESLRSLLPIPILTGLPFGHVREKITLPVGGHASIAISSDGYRLDLSGYNKTA